ncbi:hypothetical protein BCR36DRAFT_588195 [Piromyces finnis]|uniref:Uncharacterized protein n=1 Tax=Piromyces finnis TaxID=1754191 RepID=A0A1Y1URV0_9FUNG|nr:hypothetical protein BCR36DRAFT_588195 [Piromyces finnis]|eukprot:ORX40357.1 hypothetical protein BCR36DRAFT_588195 [Piromyces finnis]
MNNSINNMEGLNNMNSMNSLNNMNKINTMNGMNTENMMPNMNQTNGQMPSNFPMHNQNINGMNLPPQVNNNMNSNWMMSMESNAAAMNYGSHYVNMNNQISPMNGLMNQPQNIPGNPNNTNMMMGMPGRFFIYISYMCYIFLYQY